MTDRASFQNPPVVNSSLTAEELERILSIQAEMLASAVVRRDYNQLLDKLCALAESFTSNAVATVMLFDGARDGLFVESAPSLTQEAIEIINGLRLGDGSCGNAVFHNEPMFVFDTQTDARWEGMGDVASRLSICSCFSFPIRDAAGNSIGSFAISSLEKRAIDGFHESLLQTCANICSVILQRKKDEDLRNQTLEEQIRTERVESLGVLAGGIAHDFNNLLAAIMGSVDLALLTTMAEPAKEELGLAMKAISRARELTSQLQTISKGESHIREPANIEHIIRDSAKIALTGSNVTFELKPADGVAPVLEVDSGQISQLIQNLVINARQGMTDGGTVKISCAKVNETDHQSLHPGSYLKIAIADSGKGIPKAVLERVFEPYFTTRDEGQGLGLFLCYSIVQRHGGRILIESDCNVGTTASVYLPWQKSISLSSRSNKPRSEPSLGGGTVLIMDDHSLVRATLRKILERLGYDVVAASNGEEVLAEFSKIQDHNPFEFVILDLTIPGGMGGIETRDRIRSLYPDAKIIVSSGYSKEFIRIDNPSSGFDGSISKPYTVADVRNVLLNVR